MPSVPIVHWLKAFRLRTLPLAFSCIITGTGIAHKEGFFSYKILGLALLTTLLLQILSNLANDYGDYTHGADNEDRIGPLRAVQSGAISSRDMYLAIILFSLLSLLSGLTLLFTALGGQDLMKTLAFLCLGIGAIWAAIRYTSGKNPYGYKGLGDVFVFIFFGLVGVIGSYLLYSDQYSYQLLLPATSIGCFSTAVLNLNNMRDRINDQAVGKITVAVRLGFSNAKRYQYALILIGWLLVILYTYLNYHSVYQLLFMFSLPLFVKIMVSIHKIESPIHFDPLLKIMALGTFIFSLLFALGNIAS